MSNTQPAYTADDIDLLDDREHVRLRTQIYLGNMSPSTYTVPLFVDGKLRTKQFEFIPAVYKAVNEIIENSIDEFAKINSRDKTLKIVAEPEQGIYTITDNGRGVPIEVHPNPKAKGKRTPEVVFGMLRSGRNFSQDKEAGVIGQNGVGSACVNYCSTDFEVVIHRDKQKYHQKFVNGAQKVSRPKITASSRKTGTSIHMLLDPEIFSDVSLPPELIRNRALELALTNPGITVETEITSSSINAEDKFKSRKGFADIIEQMVANAELDDASYSRFEFEDDKMKCEFFVVFNITDTDDEQVFTWVNSSLLIDGGLCNTQFVNVFSDAVIDHLGTEARRQKIEVTKNDVRRGLTVIGNIKIKDPQYDAQSKLRFTGPSLRDEFKVMVENGWRSFARRNRSWLNEVLEKAARRYRNQADKEAIDQHKRRLGARAEGLLDASGKDRSTCKLLVTEGKSAKGQISEARDPETMAVFPLRGKVNNVHGANVAELLNMGKLADLLKVIGLVPGRKAVRSDLNFGQVWITTDADFDGDDIFTLLCNVFYQFWPELFDKNYEPFICRLGAPNVCAVKGKKRVHFAKLSDFEAVKDKYKGWTINYYKGLGSMELEDWEMVLNSNQTLTPIVDDGKMQSVLDLLFGPSEDARKLWLTKENND